MWSVDGRIHTSLISCPISHWSPLFRARKLAYFVLMIVWIISCFFPAKICLFQHRFCWRSDFWLVPLPRCNVSTNVVETQIANPNIDWLYLHMLHVPTVCVPFACTHMGSPISQFKSIHLSQSFVCLWVTPSVSFIYLFMILVPCLKQLVCSCICIWLQPLSKSQFALRAICSSAAAKFHPRRKGRGN